MHKPFIFAALALTLMTGVALADESSPAPAAASADWQAHLRARFQKADVNGDGQLSAQEAQQGMPRVYKHFNQIDTAGKGYVTLQQIQEFVAARAAARHARGGTPADPGI